MGRFGVGIALFWNDSLFIFVLSLLGFVLRMQLEGNVISSLPEMKGKKFDAVVLGRRGGVDSFKPEVWITAYPTPYSEKYLTLSE